MKANIEQNDIAYAYLNKEILKPLGYCKKDREKIITKLNNLESIVLKALTEYKQTRKDDFYLYYAVCKLKGIDTSKSFQETMKYHKEMGCPSFESVTRCRRKIQETRQDLIDWGTAKIRRDEEDEFRDYSRKGV